MIAIKPDGRRITIKPSGKLDFLFSLKLQGIDIKKDTIVFLSTAASSENMKEKILKILDRTKEVQSECAKSVE